MNDSTQVRCDLSNHLLTMLNWRKLLLLIISSALYTMGSAQVTLEVIIESGTATSDCRDFVGPPEHIWSTNVNDQGWVNFDAEGSCNLLTSLPHTAYQVTFDCPDDIPANLPVCLRAFENNPGLGNPCSNIQRNDCIAEICENFSTTFTTPEQVYTLSLPNNGDARGEVQFRIRKTGLFPGGTNNLPCTAIDLGVLSAGTFVGNASQSVFNNYCGTRSANEPDPIVQFAGWGNNAGVWYTFRTNDTPGDRFQINAISDPSEVGDLIFLQVGIFETSDNTCSGDFIYLGGSGRSRDDTSLSERLEFGCDEPLKPNTDYYILVDGVVDTQDELFGVFGLEVVSISYEPTELNETLCAGESLTVFGNTYTESGTYRDEMTVGFNCDSIVLTNLTILEPLVATYEQTNNATAENEANGSVTINVSGGAGGYQILWSDNEVGAQRSDLLGGTTYTVDISDANGCTTNLEIPIEFNNFLTAQISNDTLNCFGDQNGRLVLRVENGEAPYDYRWQSLENAELNGEGTVRRAGDIAGITNLAAGEYEIVIEDGSSPTVTIIGTVVQPDELVATINNLQNVSCFGACDGQFELTVSGGTLPYDLGIPDQDENSTFAALQDLCPGVFTSLITDAKGCATTLQAEIGEPAELIVRLENSQDVACFEGEDGRLVISSNGENVIYDWSNGQSGAVLDRLIAGNYVVTATDENGCQTSQSFAISQPNEPLSASIDIIKEISCGGEADGVLIATSGNADSDLQYNWSNGATSESISDLAAGVYEVTITNENGCSAATQLSLTEPTPLSLLFSTENIGCLDVPNAGAILIEDTQGGRAPYQYSIDGVLFISTPRIANLFEGNYELIARDASGCELIQTATIEGPPEITVNLGEDEIIQLGEQMTLTAFTSSENPIFSWQSEDTLACKVCNEIVVSPTQSSVYSVTVTDELTQCRATDRIEILVDNTRRLFIPNVFSPNGDNVNDRFTIFGGNMITQINYLRIFNRRGELLFETNNIAPNDELQGWNGRLNGTILPTDTYIYSAEIAFVDGESEVYSGSVVLMR